MVATQLTPPAVDILPPPELRGNNRAGFDSQAREIILSGPAGTGKSRTCLEKLHWWAQQSEYPGARLLILRKTRESLNESVLVTFEDEVLERAGMGALASGAKRESRRAYTYPNGSAVIVAGLTQSSKDQRAKVMSTQYDLIYVAEATELTRDEWEKLTTRLRHGKLPFQQIIGDCNPDAPTHWIWSRQLSGKCQFLPTVHEDNPALHDGTTWTPEGAEYLERLSQLTGYMRDRYYEGKWSQASGIVYDTWADPGNVTELAVYEPGAGPVVWAVDDGYSAGSAPGTRGLDPHTGTFVADAHPRAILLLQIKPDGHWDIFAESYHCLKLSDTHIQEVKDWSAERGWPEPEFAVHGPGTAEIRGRLFAAGIYPRACTATVEESIKELRSALAADKQGWRRARVHPGCAHLRSEMVSYAYDPATGKPAKQFDHGTDALRYFAFAMRNQKQDKS